MWGPQLTWEGGRARKIEAIVPSAVVGWRRKTGQMPNTAICSMFQELNVSKLMTFVQMKGNAARKVQLKVALQELPFVIYPNSAIWMYDKPSKCWVGNHHRVKHIFPWWRLATPVVFSCFGRSSHWAPFPGVPRTRYLRSGQDFEDANLIRHLLEVKIANYCKRSGWNSSECT